MPGSTTKAVQIARRLANGDFGYSQSDRWSGLKQGALNEPGNFDCSSSTGVVMLLAGYPVDITGTFWTGNIADRLVKAGFRKVSAKGKSLAWLRRNVVAGSALVGPGHVVAGVGDGKVLSFEADEHGRGTGGKRGDQTGSEGRIRDIYRRSRGWEWLLLPPADAKPVYRYPTLKRGSKGALVKLYQRTAKRRHPVLARKAARQMGRKAFAVDGDYGLVTVRLTRLVEARYHRKVTGKVRHWMWRHLGLAKKVRREA